MSRRKTRTKLQKQKKMTLSSPVISPDDIVTCTATVGDWIIIATCKRSESKQCMRELKDSPSDKKEGPVPRDFFDPTPEQQSVVLINATTLREAERLIDSCEGCNPINAEIPFDGILDRVTGSDPSVTDYILESPAKCPNCRRAIFERYLSSSLKSVSSKPHIQNCTDHQRTAQYKPANPFSLQA